MTEGYKLRGLDLFSGVGGLSLALKEWVQPIAYCEIDRYCQAVLLSRQASLHLQRAPIWDDITTLRRDRHIDGTVDIIYGGFPCQDISVAGTRVGLEGKRSGLFFEIIRLTKELRPTFVFLENVPGIRTKGLSDVIKAFTDIGYDCRWTLVSAKELGAAHIRKRWFLLAHANCAWELQQKGRIKNKRRWPGNSVESVILANDNSGYLREQSGGSRREKGKDKAKPCRAGKKRKTKKSTHANGQRLEGVFNASRSKPSHTIKEFKNMWSIEPVLDGKLHGIQNRMDRIKAMGNSVVPVQAREAFRRLITMEETKSSVPETKPKQKQVRRPRSK